MPEHERTDSCNYSSIHSSWRAAESNMAKSAESSMYITRSAIVELSHFQAIDLLFFRLHLLLLLERGRDAVANQACQTRKFIIDKISVYFIICVSTYPGLHIKPFMQFLPVPDSLIGAGSSFSARPF